MKMENPPVTNLEDAIVRHCAHLRLRAAAAASEEERQFYLLTAELAAPFHRWLHTVPHLLTPDQALQVAAQALALIGTNTLAQVNIGCSPAEANNEFLRLVAVAMAVPAITAFVARRHDA